MTPLVLSLFASLGLTPVVRWLAVRLGFVDLPGPRKLHTMPVPLMGSAAIYLAVVLAIIFSAGRHAISEYGGILAGATLLVVVGILDDRGLLHHQVKLFVAMPAAALLLLASGIRAGIVSALLPGPVGVVL